MPSAPLSPSLVSRILSRLEAAEGREPNPHLQDDQRIAWITVLRASRGESISHVSATYTVLGLHPDKVWPSIVERRKSLLGAAYETWGAASSQESLPPKKRARSAGSFPARMDRAA